MGDKSEEAQVGGGTLSTEKGATSQEVRIQNPEVRIQSPTPGPFNRPALRYRESHRPLRHSHLPESIESQRPAPKRAPNPPR
jgi:hypothetical protein